VQPPSFTIIAMSPNDFVRSINDLKGVPASGDFFARIETGEKIAGLVKIFVGPPEYYG
jgi:hypothetical protein